MSVSVDGPVFMSGLNFIFVNINKKLKTIQQQSITKWEKCDSKTGCESVRFIPRFWSCIRGFMKLELQVDPRVDPQQPLAPVKTLKFFFLATSW